MEQQKKEQLAPITLERRQQILAKDLITINELGELLGVPYSTAQRVMKTVKRKTDRLELSGMLHIQDYIDYFNLPVSSNNRPLPW